MRYVKGIVKARNGPVSSGPRKRATNRPPTAARTTDAILLVRVAIRDRVVWWSFTLFVRILLFFVIIILQFSKYQIACGNFGQFFNEFFYQVSLHIAMNLSGRNPEGPLLKLNVIIFIEPKSDFSLADNYVAIEHDLSWFLLRKLTKNRNI